MPKELNKSYDYDKFKDIDFYFNEYILEYKQVNLIGLLQVGKHKIPVTLNELEKIKEAVDNAISHLKKLI